MGHDKNGGHSRRHSAERGVPSKLLSTHEIAGMVVRLATDRSLNGRIVVWWSEDSPGLIEWGDRGYRNVAELPACRVQTPVTIRYLFGLQKP